MKTTCRAWLLAITVTAAVLFSFRCTPPNDVGKDIIPDDEIVIGNYVDTFTITFTTLPEVKITTEDASRSLIGNYVDEEFGHIYAESYFQVRIVGSNLVFGENPANLVLDSIVLSLDLTDFYGRFNDPVELEIFEIKQDFPVDSALDNNTVLAIDSSYDYANGATIDFSQLNGFLDFVRFRLDDSLGRKLLFASTDSLATNTIFTDFFKGLCIRSKSVNQSISREPGGIFQWDPTSSVSEVILYYKDTTSSKEYGFDISQFSDRYHRVIRTDVNGRLFEQILQDTVLSQPPYGAIQAGSLVNLFVGIPGMKNLDPAGINSALLILPLDPNFFGSDGRFEPPNQIFVYVANAEGTGIDSTAFIPRSATYDPVNQRYVVPVTNNLQNILADRLPDSGFIIVPGESSITVNRAIFAGPGHPNIDLHPKLQVVFTSIPGGG